MSGFDLFIGIDWSGARGECHKGIQLAEAQIGQTAPILINPSTPKGWSRQDVITRLKSHAAAGRHVLAGIDLAFCHPFGDQGYYPDLSNPPQTAQALWALIDQVNQDQDHFYGGGIWGHPELRHYYNAPKKDGKGMKFTSRRRQTEQVTKDLHKRSPSPTFNCVGPAGVGTGSLAGMRMLHHMQDHASIWPMAMRKRIRGQGSITLVEIFPALYFKMAEVSDKDKRTDPLAALNQGLTHFNSTHRNEVAQGLPDQDDIDAIISAAALRALHHPHDVFPIDEAYRDDAMKEGWIFGAGHVKT